MNLWRSGYGLMATSRLSSDEESSLPLANDAFPCSQQCSISMLDVGIFQ